MSNQPSEDEDYIYSYGTIDEDDMTSTGNVGGGFYNNPINPPSNGVIGKSSIPANPISTGTIGSGAGVNGTIGGAGAGSIIGRTYNLNYTMNQASWNQSKSNVVSKTDVVYVVVLPDNSCLEMVLDNPITPREMIGVCSFINTVQMSIQSGIEVDWEEFISILGIDRHFRGGEIHHSHYDDSGSVLYIKLFCV